MKKTLAMDMVKALEAMCQSPPIGIGRTPTREEYKTHSKFSRRQIDSVFGSYVELLLAAGRYSKNSKRVPKQDIRERVFEKLKKDVSEKKSAPQKVIKTKSLICVSDMHEPYGHPDIIPFLTALHKKYMFDTWLIGGDEVDNHGLSFHDSNPDLLSPGHELEAAISALQALYRLAPKAKVVESNHGSLFFRKSLHHGFPRHLIKSYNEILEAPKEWEWATEWVFEFPNGKRAIAHHGYSSAILLASKKRAMSLIQFHFHSNFSIQYWANKDGLYFALQCGCLIDDDSLAMEYNKLTIERPIVGVGAIIDGLPRLFPMLLNSKGRWNGVVP